MEGYLMLEISQSDFLQKWTKRWVVLKQANLLCYNDNTKTQLTESFDLSQYDDIEIVSSNTNKYQFELRSMSLWKFRSFQAVNETDLNHWMKHITNAQETPETQTNDENKKQYKRKIIDKSTDIIITGYCRQFINVSDIPNILDLCCLYFYMKKILFLDIDGVLNDKTSRPRTVKSDLLMRLKNIINITQCKIVLTSSWRRVNELKNIFKNEFNKITGIDINDIYIGDTPCNGRNPTRVHEIMEYFEIMEEKEQKKHSDIAWVVVDDMDLLNENGMGSPSAYKRILNGHWVRTNIEIGLTDQNVKQIVSILNNN